jgi:GNAT superfamily N-acetyltransferase
VALRAAVRRLRPAADAFEHPERLRYLCGADGRVEIGIGLRPDLVGRGLGEAYMRAQLEYARSHWRPRLCRLSVASAPPRAPS